MLEPTAAWLLVAEALAGAAIITAPAPVQSEAAKTPAVSFRLILMMIPP